MTLMVTRDGIEYECWVRKFIILQDGTVKRLSWARLTRVIGAGWFGKPAKGRDGFKGGEVRKSSGTRWIRVAELVVRTNLPDPIADVDFTEYEVDGRGFVVKNVRRWKPTPTQMETMRTMTLKRKIRRPSIKRVPETKRFKFN